jgi:hypothetical protein
MIKLLIFSFKKSKLLSKIANEARPKSFDAHDLLDQTIKSMTQGKTLSKRELYTEQLLTLLASDKHTTNLLTQHKRTFDDIRKVIAKLEITGAGQIVKGHYVPVSSIAFLEQLRTILENWDGENFKIEDLDFHNSNLKLAHHLIQSFE